MPHYCDSKVLEQNWFNWLLADPTPQLEVYRATGTLMTKVQKNTIEGEKVNPYWGLPQKPKFSHCIITKSPIYFKSYAGKCDTPRTFSGSKPVNCQLPSTHELQDCRDHAFIEKMIANGYAIEVPTKRSWDEMVIDIQKMCRGISMKFTMPSEDARDDLASDALLTIMNKVKNKKLIYTPGKAPVFNLLTTTIYRIIYSLLNRISKDQKDKTQHAQMIAPFTTNTFRRRNRRIILKRVLGVTVACSN